MKAIDYVEKYLPEIEKIKDEKQLKDLAFKIFMEFNDEVTTIAKERNTTRNKAVISIIKEIGQKWGKFCRLINEKQDMAVFDEKLFLGHWKKILNFD